MCVIDRIGYACCARHDKLWVPIKEYEQLKELFVETREFGGISKWGGI